MKKHAIVTKSWADVCKYTHGLNDKLIQNEILTNSPTSMTSCSPPKLSGEQTVQNSD